MSESNQEPTKLQMLLAEINKTGTSDFVGVYKQVPFRIALSPYARLTALVKYMESSRNKVLNDLLEIALDQVYSNLTPQVADTLGMLAAQTYLELNDANSSFQSGGLTDD